MIYGSKNMVIYKVTNKLNDKCYIGQTTNKFKIRKYQHLHTQKHLLISH